MAFTVRPVDAGARSGFEELHGEVKVQRLVNWNIRIDGGMYARRKTIADDENMDEHRRYGRAVTTGRGMAGDILNLNENEVLLGSRRGGDPGAWSHLAEPEAYGFQALNALVIPEGYTADDMADLHPVIGICRSAYIVSPGVPEQIANGVAAAVSGSMPLRNNSPLQKPWRPRDMLLARWPSTDPDRRRAEESRKPRSEGVDHQRLTVYVEPATYAETRLYFERELTSSFDDAPEQQARFSARTYSQRGTTPGNLTPAQRAVTTTRGTLYLAAFGLISMLLLHCEEDADIVAAVKNPVAFAGLVNNDTLDLRRNPADAPANWRTERDASLVAWSGALGCNPANTVTPVDYFLCDHIAGIALRPLLADRRLSQYFDVANLFSREKAAQARTPDGVLAVQPVLTDEVGGLVWAQGVFAPGMLTGLKQSIERLMNRYVGHALDYTAPGATGAAYRG